MHPILEQFLDRWVWPTMPGAPGAEFRLRLTKEKCVRGWEISLQRTLREIEEELGREDEAWKKDRALRGYAAEGVHMSIKQMSAQLLSVDIAEQEKYIDLQRMRERGDRRGALIRSLKAHTPRLLAVILIGQNLFMSAASA